MDKGPKQSSRSFSVFHSSTYRLAVLILVLFSLLPRVTFARASSPPLATDAGSETAADFILGPQAPISTSWFDQTQITRGKVHGEAFPATPPAPDQSDDYIMAHYYDLGLTQYIAYKRTGDPIFLTYARKVCDSWWQGPYVKGGTVRNFDTAGTSPRHAGIAGLALRALDGRPEMWDWINAYTRYHFDLWLKTRINNPELYLGIREGAFALEAAAILAKVLPDTFPLQAGGTATNGAAIRAQYLADAEAVSVNYYGRLQYADGSWRWDDPYYTDADGGNLKGITQPFMVGLLLDALIDVYQLTTNETVKTSIQNQITKSCRYLYTGGPYSTQRLSALNVNLRGFHYFYHGGTTVNPTKYEKGDLPADWNPTNPSDVQNQREPIGLFIAAFGWSYQRTGDPFFKAAGDELWDSAYGDTDGIRNYMAGDGKSYNQNCRWAASYLVWAGKPSSPGPTPTPTSTPTPAPTPTPTPMPTPTPVVTSSASFVQLDTTTKGNWKNTYGGDGYNTINDSVKYPAYAQVSVSGNSSPTWSSSTADLRALQKANTSDRVAARWESNSFFIVDLNLTDGQKHRVALYGLDWDGNNRQQRVDLLDWNTNSLLDSRTISSFNGGQYLVWDISGRVKIVVNKTGAKSAVVSGLYFGTGASATPSPTPTPTPTPSPGAPQVTLTVPPNGSVFVAGTDITLAATASDSNGSITKVDFYRSGTLIGTDTTSPYSVVWSSAQKGSYELTAKATDNSGLSTTSAPVSILVTNSPNSVNRAKGRAGSLVQQDYSGAGDPVVENTVLAYDITTLTADIEAAYVEFKAETAAFGSTAPAIETQINAATLFSKASLGLAMKAATSPNIKNNLLRIASHLAIAEDLMRFATIKQATIDQANATKTRTNVIVGQANTGYGMEFMSSIAPGSIGSISGSANLQPMLAQTVFASLSSNGSLPYEVGGLSVTVGGVAVPVLYASPWGIKFLMPVETPLGFSEIVVSSQDGYICQGLVSVGRIGSRIMTINDADSGSLVVVNGHKKTSNNFEITTLDNFGTDKRTRLSFFATGVSATALNSNPANDISIHGNITKNFAESITVEARLSNGQVYTLPVEFAGANGGLPGLDQITVILSPELRGAGTVQLSLIIGGERSNAPTVTIN